MRVSPLLIAAVSLAACAKNETPKPDSTAPAAAAAPAPPAAVTAADVAGTFTGQVMAQNNDSVLFKFVCVQPATGNTSKCTNNVSKDTTAYTYTLSGADSVMWTSVAYTPPTPPKSPKVIDHVVGRMTGGKWGGTVVTVLASKPDSVVNRTRWEATKTP